MRRIYYKNLHLMSKCFVGGTVVRHVEGDDGYLR
jgi:hypothetical protein